MWSNLLSLGNGDGAQIESLRIHDEKEKGLGAVDGSQRWQGTVDRRQKSCNLELVNDLEELA